MRTKPKIAKSALAARAGQTLWLALTRTVKRGWIASLLATVLAVGGIGAAQAASGGQGSGYGLDLDVNTVGLTVVGGNGNELAAISRTAPPDFNAQNQVASVGLGVNLALVRLLSLNTGVINTQTQSVLAQNSVKTTSQVDGLNLSLVNVLGADLLKLGAGAITTEAEMYCEAGAPKARGGTRILNATGLLASYNGVNLAVGSPEVVINVAGVAKVYLNRQQVTGNSVRVNGVVVEINVLNLIKADVVIGEAYA